jgi:hypothetical protein
LDMIAENLRQQGHSEDLIKSVYSRLSKSHSNYQMT